MKGSYYITYSALDCYILGWGRTSAESAKNAKNYLQLPEVRNVRFKTIQCPKSFFYKLRGGWSRGDSWLIVNDSPMFMDEIRYAAGGIGSTVKIEKLNLEPQEKDHHSRWIPI